MKDTYTHSHHPPAEDIRCIDDCTECPFFFRFDVCGYETTTIQYFGKEDLASWF